MSPEATFLFLLIGFVCFIVAVVLDAAGVAYARLNLIAGGLASWIFISLYTALKAL